MFFIVRSTVNCDRSPVLTFIEDHLFPNARAELQDAIKERTLAY